MPLNLTRKDMYDLVWSKPRSEIAKQLGISDVRLGKLCREMNVPAPPRGYWANLAGSRKKRRYAKPALTYTVAERIEEDHAAVWVILHPELMDAPNLYVAHPGCPPAGRMLGERRAQASGLDHRSSRSPNERLLPAGLDFTWFREQSGPMIPFNLG